MDRLFDTPAAELSAPQAYWLPHGFTTALMVVRPSRDTYTRLVGRVLASPTGADLGSTGPRADMDLLNEEFAGTYARLPRDSFCLNTDWETQMGGEEADGRCAYVHFSVLLEGGSKPWQVSPGGAAMDKPEAHQGFATMFEEWRTGARDFCLWDWRK